MSNNTVLTYTIGIDSPEFIISTTESVFDKTNKQIDLVLSKKLSTQENSLQTCVEDARLLYFNIFVYDLNNQLHQQIKFSDIKIMFHDVKNGLHVVKFSYLTEAIIV